MKKLLVIKGSSRSGSITNSLLNDSLYMLDGVEVTEFNAFSEKFAFCNGCNYCWENGKCIHRDLDGLFKSFEEADIVVFSSPIYNGGFSAPVKAVLDRLQVYYTSFYKNNKVQKIKKHRRVILLTAAGRDGTAAANYMEKNLKCALTVLSAELVGTVLCSYTDTVYDYKRALNYLTELLKKESEQ